MANTNCSRGLVKGVEGGYQHFYETLQQPVANREGQIPKTVEGSGSLLLRDFGVIGYRWQTLVKEIWHGSSMNRHMGLNESIHARLPF